MEYFEYVLMQPPIASAIFRNLRLTEVLALTGVSRSTQRAVLQHMELFESHTVKFSYFAETYHRLHGFYSLKDNLKSMNILLDDGTEEFPSVVGKLCDFVSLNSGLKSLNVRAYYDIPAQVLNTICTKLRHLEALDLAASPFSDIEPRQAQAFFKNLARNCPGLREVAVRNFADDASIAAMSRLNLVSVSLADCEVSDVGMTSLTHACPLERVQLLNARVSAASLHALATNCSGSLRELVVCNPELMSEADGLHDVIERCNKLERLKFHHESWRLFVEWRKGGEFEFSFQRRPTSELLFDKLSAKLDQARRVRVAGDAIPTSMYDAVQQRCRHMTSLDVTRHQWKSASLMTEGIDESRFVSDVCRWNKKLENLSLDLCHIDLQACEAIAESDVRQLKIKFDDDLAVMTCAAGLRKLETKFINSSRVKRVFFGKTRRLNE